MMDAKWNTNLRLSNNLLELSYKRRGQNGSLGIDLV